ncbi:cytochrome c oxidase subunit 4 [Demequina muriae]|uniref:Cytochrome c oxidase polypeptide 4 n=1 Tax=Demequina muriae TaxID=3051664 RepID=A0ABT8GJE9_9MICO|nr:cytochrome c oxidase subunit 4 [Demequina sp. EGI L300058]MDN4481552.1 cytochrome c oxidase subunit 4 [Demequina sp. EGI L300058]
MRLESNVFWIPSIFFFLAGTLYGIFTSWSEWVGIVAILLTGGMFIMIGIYFKMLEKRHGRRPEDDEDAHISELAGSQGVYAPWSWWPLVIALGSALAFVAMAVGWWIMVPAVIIGSVGLVGWVFEFSTGRHAH